MVGCVLVSPWKPSASLFLNRTIDMVSDITGLISVLTLWVGTRTFAIGFSSRFVVSTSMTVGSCSC